MDNIFGKAFKVNSDFFSKGLSNGKASRQIDNLSHLNTGGKATLSGTFTTLLAMYFKGNVSFNITSPPLGGKGTIASCKSRSNILRQYNILWSDSKLYYFVNESGIKKSYDFGDLAHWSLFAPLFYKLLQTDSEFQEAIKELSNDFTQNSKFTNTKSLYIYNDLMYWSKNIYPSDAFSNIFAVPDDSVSKSSDSVGKAGNVKKTQIDNFDNDKYRLSLKELTDEEKKLIPKFEPNVDIIITEDTIDVLDVVKGEYDSVMPVHNILLYGEAGAGKSTNAKIFAWAFGLPYYAFDISKNIDEITLTAGTKLENGSLIYTDTDVVKAVRCGGVLELREIYTAKAGVQVALNGLLEEGKLRLPSGEVVERNRNCIIIGTTNVNYAGCEDFDKSTDDRFQEQLRIEPMPEEKILQVISYKSGNSDMMTLKKLYEAWLMMRKKISEEQIDGEATMRKLIMWAKNCKYKPVIKSAKMTILSGISKDTEVQEDILNSIISPMFN